MTCVHTVTALLDVSYIKLSAFRPTQGDRIFYFNTNTVINIWSSDKNQRELQYANYQYMMYYR